MDVIAKIKALREKAANAASTEAEVQASLKRADKLMRKHGVTEKQIDRTDAASLQPVYWTTGTKALPSVQDLAKAISAFTETTGWIRTDAEGYESIAYLGMEQDVEMALYLTDLLHNAMQKEWGKFSKKLTAAGITSRARVKAKRDFNRAMAARLRARIMDMVAQKVSDTVVTDGQALVVMKRDLISKAQAELGLKIRTVKTRRKVIKDVGAALAGVRAGDRTNITTGIAA